MAILDPANSAVDRIRLNVGDTSDLPRLTDDVIEYYLSYNSNNESATTKQCAMLILAQMAHEGHDKISGLEFWGNEVYTNYKSFLKEVINGGLYNATGGIYVAGMLKEDVAENNSDDTIVQHKLPIYDYEDYDNDIRTSPVVF